MQTAEAKDSSIELEPSIAALPIWLGRRLLDNSDLHTFYRQFCLSREFPAFDPIALTEIDSSIYYKERYLPRLKRTAEEILQMIQFTARSNQKIAVFFILSAQAAESCWARPFMNVIEKNAKSCYFYKIIMGYGFKNADYGKDKDSIFSTPEKRAHELGMAHIHFNSDAPTNGGMRLVELMNRVLGMDLLPEQKFPDYSKEDLQKIAWHISRESFNYMSERPGSIPKYRIENGKPIFRI